MLNYMLYVISWAKAGMLRGEKWIEWGWSDIKIYKKKKKKKE